ncbi:surfeit locus protein 2 [Clupea harengus]|uniref:Surfeit locus protein 2 n=1 Tax=Clupea harengus TaxID=7950 RepID=A0A6P3VEW3_CLUHA|nr:surfeit locus protein 2 [Clupea harengus]
MADLPTDLKDFLQNHPFLQVIDANKIKCTLNGHEFPCNLIELKNFTSGKKFKKLSAVAEFDYSQYEPHVVSSRKEPNHLFCKLTLRHINRLPHQVLRHVNGKRFQKALQKYKECQQQGVAYVPAPLRQKKRPRDADDCKSERQNNHKKKGNGEMWEPNSSEGEGSDSEDSLSDLYPSTLFTVNEPEKTAGGEEDGDDFETDNEEMEVSATEEEKQGPQKRKKMQSGNFEKKFKNSGKRKGFKFTDKNRNGK